MIKHQEQFFDCYKCGSKQSVKIIYKEHKDSKSMEIKKCSSCKYPHTLGQFFKNMEREQAPKAVIS